MHVGAGANLRICPGAEAGGAMAGDGVDVPSIHRRAGGMMCTGCGPMRYPEP
jgi:hypothetical protein